MIKKNNAYNKIIDTRLNTEEIAILWLGQAGFLIKDSRGVIIVIDPYVSDCGERLKGFVRQSPKAINIDELNPDLYITTHLHFDHFDFDAIPIVSKNSRTLFLGPYSCCNELLEMGVANTRIIQLDLYKEIEHRNIKIRAVYADHGAMAPDAIGVLVKLSGIQLYFSGDTAYRPEKLYWIDENPPDISFLSINGKFGNLNAEEGAFLTRDLKTKVAVPCHYGTFNEHGGDPLEFAHLVGILAPDCQVIIMNQDDPFLYHK